MKLQNIKTALILSVFLGLSAGCGSENQNAAVENGSSQLSDAENREKKEKSAALETDVYVDRSNVAEVMIEDEMVALAGAPAAVPGVLLPVASGTAVEQNEKAEIDYSNISDGYVMVRWKAAAGQKIKVQVAGPGTTYTYDLAPGGWVTFPLSDGNGGYKITVFENVTGSKYATVLSASFQVSLKDEFAPFIRPNQYVDYSVAPNTVAKAQELAGNSRDPLVKVEKIYNFVVQNLSYDQNKASTVKSGYLPVLDNVLASGKGICFDYASLMTGMLRSQGVPCKLVVGYAGSAYHAWINVWTESTGWIDGVIFFDGTTWQRMDPTFASSGNRSETIMQFIGNGNNYVVKYLY